MTHEMRKTPLSPEFFPELLFNRYISLRQTAKASAICNPKIEGYVRIEEMKRHEYEEGSPMHEKGLAFEQLGADIALQRIYNNQGIPTSKKPVVPTHVVSIGKSGICFGETVADRASQLFGDSHTLQNIVIEKLDTEEEIEAVNIETHEVVTAISYTARGEKKFAVPRNVVGRGDSVLYTDDVCAFGHVATTLIDQFRKHNEGVVDSAYISLMAKDFQGGLRRVANECGIVVFSPIRVKRIVDVSKNKIELIDAMDGFDPILPKAA